MTLLELIVVLAILGILAAVATATSRPIARLPAENPALDAISKLRWSVVSRAQPLTSALVINGVMLRVTAFPDGRVLTAPDGYVQQLNGRPLAER